MTPDEFRNGLATLGIVCADDEFTRLMDIVDHDGGGDINYNEFAQKLKQHDAQTHDGFSFEEKKIAHAAQGISHDDAVLHHGGALRGAEELITMIAHKVEQKSKNVKTVYRLFDNDSSMGVDRSEFVTGLQKLGLALSTKELDSVLHVIDADGSGEIDFNEFTSALKESDGQTHDHFAHHHKDKKKVQAAQRMSIKDGHQTGKRREGLQLLSMIRSKVEEKVCILLFLPRPMSDNIKRKRASGGMFVGARLRRFLAACTCSTEQLQMHRQRTCTAYSASSMSTTTGSCPRTSLNKALLILGCLCTRMNCEV